MVEQIEQKKIRTAKQIPAAVIAQIRKLRSQSLSIDRISREVGISRYYVTKHCSDVQCLLPGPGRVTPLSEADVAAIFAGVRRGVARVVLANHYHISVPRLNNLLGQGQRDVSRQAEDDAREVKFASELELVRKPLLDEADFQRAGVPDTPEHRLACRGRSRQWMRLYALRVANPGCKDYGDHEHATVPRFS